MPKWLLRKKFELAYSTRGNGWQYLMKGKKKEFIWTNYFVADDLYEFNSRKEALDKMEDLKEGMSRKCTFQAVKKEDVI